MILGLEKMRPSFAKVKKILNDDHYTHIIFNNFIPTVSLALPELCKKKSVITLYWVHNARLSCANGLLYNGREFARVDSARCRHESLRLSHWMRKVFCESWKPCYAFWRKPKLISHLVDLLSAPRAALLCPIHPRDRCADRWHLVVAGPYLP